jgi:hypothetical protein
MSDQEALRNEIARAVLRAQAEALRAQADQIESRYCTGLTAAWCPIHGDCVCDRENSMDADDCPLHNDLSHHAEGSAR